MKLKGNWNLKTLARNMNELHDVACSNLLARSGAVSRDVSTTRKLTRGLASGAHTRLANDAFNQAATYRGDKKVNDTYSTK